MLKLEERTFIMLDVLNNVASYTFILLAVLVFGFPCLN